VQASLEERVSQLELQTSADTCGARVPDATKDTQGNFSLTFDVVYWKPRTDLTEFGRGWKQDLDILERHAATTVKTHKFDFEFGFKAGIGYHFDTKGWDLNALYTYCNWDDTDLAGGAKGVIYAPSPVSPLPIEYAGYASVKSTYEIGYQTVELALSKGFFINQYTSITPFYGVKAAWINHLPNTIAQIVLLSDLDTVLGDENSHQSEKMRGLGPMGGFDFNWYFCDGWSLYTKTAASLIFASLRSSASTIGALADDNQTLTRREIGASTSKQYVTTNLFMSLGLSYEHYFEEAGSALSFFAGYETQIYMDQSHAHSNPSTLASNGARNKRSLSIMGLTAGATFDF